LIDFAKNGGDKDVASALAAFGEAMRAQKASGIDKAAKALQSALGKSQDAIDKHFQKQVR
jgi:bifunctional ADP-heptose synthase (sugar kinase/adenylyltransferase)